MHVRPTEVLAARARSMRLAPTCTEALLWEALRGRRLDDIAFRRQAPLGRYIVDFLAPKHRLVVEVDGGYHYDRARSDRRRDRDLARLGYRVLRLPEELVQRRLVEALDQIRLALLTGCGRKRSLQDAAIKS